MQLEANYQKAATQIRAAAQQGAELAVLPEYHLLNWIPQDPGFKEACGHWQKYLTNYRDLAKEHNINIVPGTILELHRAGTKDEVLLKIHASALNPVDWKLSKYDYSIEKFPSIRGSDIAGEIVKLGEGVTRFALGDRV